MEGWRDGGMEGWRDEMGWDGMGWDGMGWEGKGREGKGRDAWMDGRGHGWIEPIRRYMHVHVKLLRICLHLCLYICMLYLRM